ncbi:hypothetical protein [Neobacillus cucumis]|uniref:Uncharacterized protein n=1 Tax=Neobacillus cucumis TaxID=1740721 RepID=A0A2N5HCE5_9BACI|nr:hypothetical protein [Neobacillus cucumis]PLS03178.1 hypothetical protein CVD27_16095 [Neobacillus cucumis]
MAFFFKISIYCFAAINVAAHLFKIEKPNKLVLPTGITIEHLEEGAFIIRYILPIFCVGIPVILFLVDLIRKRFS